MRMVFLGNMRLHKILARDIRRAFCLCLIVISLREQSQITPGFSIAVFMPI
jgi:hypothetical protein